VDEDPPLPEDDGTSGEGAWIELAVVADLEAVEPVSEILGRFAPGGTSVEPGFALVEDGLAATVDPSRPAIVRAYLPARDTAAARTAIADARRALGHLQAFGLRPIGDLTTRVVHEADWAQAWKAFFPVLRIGRRVVIRPTWRRHRRLPADIVLALDPGMAFGTGLHPTTRLCLEALERLAEAGELTHGLAWDGSARVLDVGIGSGILAIAAGLFGAGELVGVDTDPIAVDASATNARRNRVARRLRVRTGSLPSGSGPFDVVLANLIASVLVALAGPLRDELRPGGTLLASGIYGEREPEVRAAFASAGLRVVDRAVEGDWVALTAVREPASG
jgi:ribosomal protein L11 methyltransferase